MTNPVRLLDLFRYYRGVPHQMAAISELQEAMIKADASLLNRDQPWFKTWSTAGKQPGIAEPTWFEPARKIVAEFEGCKLEPYRCAAGIPTIGYGHTGPDITMSHPAITQQQADDWLIADLQHFADGIHRLIPGSRQWGANQQAAVISWAFNVSLGAVESSTLRRRLLAGESAVIVIPEELPKWNKADGQTLPGLVRRRTAEVALFTGGTMPLQQSGITLKVPYEAQNDNASGTGYRECFSSSAAMVARFYGKVSSDDAYNKIRAKYGDTTDAQAQVKALNSLGLNAHFRTNATPAILETELKAGRPVMVGWLHKGPATKPSGSGHWSVIIGFDATHWVHNDPNGEADMVNGGYVNHSKGAGIRYSRKNFDRRWLVDGPATGWCITVAG
ncbi:MAG: glycoside hydrolase family protein [Cyanobacteriota bacterium]|nr:glycoside hydrolase family protein [Cyanobacteriota bacterium]